MGAGAEGETRVHLHDDGVGIRHLLVVRTDPKALAKAHGVKILQPLALPDAVLDHLGADESRWDAESVAQKRNQGRVALAVHKQRLHARGRPQPKLTR